MVYLHDEHVIGGMDERVFVVVVVDRNTFGIFNIWDVCIFMVVKNICGIFVYNI